MKIYFTPSIICILFFTGGLMLSFNSFGQSGKIVNGQVTNASLQPLAGVSVIIKGTGIGTSTNSIGRYQLTVPDKNSTLVFSFVGFETKEVAAADELSVALDALNQNLNEVVVIGYGTQTRSKITGAVASVSGKDLQKLSVSGVDQALQGQVAGLQISSTSGAPGGNTNILVRGIGSISGGVEPLFVIDGFPINNAGVGNPLNTINPGDIESIEVLKDASSTAIYGSRGSNGVIIITTKHGKAGQNRITLDAYTGIQQAEKQMKLMNATQFRDYFIEGHNNGWLENGGQGASINDPNSVRAASYRIPVAWQDPNNLPPYDTDWLDAIFRTAPIQNYQIIAQGGNEKIRYSLSGGYFDQKGILINSGFKRYSARLNVDAQVTKRLKIVMSLAPSYTNTDNVPASGQVNTNIISAAWSLPPLIPVYNPDGSYGNTYGLVNEGEVPIQNPVQIANELLNKNSQFRMLANTYGEYELLDGLKLKVSLGTDFNYFGTNLFSPSSLTLVPTTASTTNNEDINWLNENTINYRRTIKKHSFDALAGFTVQKSSGKRTLVSSTDFPDNLISNVNGGKVNGGSYTVNEWSLLSYLSRINYSYNDRYLLTAAIRTDGSSRFGSANRWGVFPSFSAGWRISEEDFLKNADFLNDLKIRASYGLSGNNAIGNYRYIGLLSSTNYVLGNQEAPGLSQSSFTNDNLGWETSKQLDIGLDFSIFNNRLQFTGDYYKRINSDMLLNKAIPSVTGYTNAWVNLGELENKGVELALTGRIISGHSFQWTSSFNITFNKNKVLKLGSTDEKVFSDGGRGNNNLTVTGRPIGSFYGHVYEGIFMSDEEIAKHAVQTGAKPGDIRFKDVDGNGVINDNDRDFIGNPQPKFFYGFNNTVSYKNWSLNILVNGTQGNDVFWAGGIFIYSFSGVHNNLAALSKNHWKSANEPGDGKNPRFIRGGRNNNPRFSSFYIFDGSYLRVRNVTLNYNIPQRIVSKAGMKAARIYLTATNLFTITKYPGTDPELSNSEDNLLASGIDYGGYPLPRTINAGVSLTF